MTMPPQCRPGNGSKWLRDLKNLWIHGGFHWRLIRSMRQPAEIPTPSFFLPVSCRRRFTILMPHSRRIWARSAPQSPMKSPICLMTAAHSMTRQATSGTGGLNMIIRILKSCAERRKRTMMDMRRFPAYL